MRQSGFVALLAGAAIAAIAPAARANGRFPAAGQIAIDPSDPNHIVVRATYGLVTTRDAGGAWDWICEAALGYAGVEDPAIAITADGSIDAGLFEGLSVTHGDSCAWAFATALANVEVVDTSTERAMPATSVALGWVNGVTRVFRSNDDAQTWSQAGADLPAGFSGVTIDVAPSNPNVVVVSGTMNAPATGGGLAISQDGGSSWQRVDIPGADEQHVPYLGAIDASTPSVMYVRIRADVDTLVVSSDGGGSWKQVFQGKGGLFGFALSPDGSKVAIGGTNDGVWVAPTATLAFVQQSTLGVRCLTWGTNGLYACATEAIDGFTIGASKDDGKTFAPIMHQDAIRGPLACPATSSVGAKCPSVWPMTQCTLEPGTCAPMGGDVGVAETAPAKSGGCGCRFGSERDSFGGGVAAALALVFVRRKRRVVRTCGARVLSQAVGRAPRVGNRPRGRPA